MAHLIGRALFHAQMAEMREARKQVTFAIFSEEEDLNKVTVTVDALFTLLQRSYKA
jgi:type I restriction enzyme R subunit